jgi:hypothetical protein
MNKKPMKIVSFKQRVKNFLLKIARTPRYRTLAFVVLFAVIGGIIIFALAASEPQVVSIVSPHDGDTVSGITVDLNASVQDGVHVKKVDYYINNVYVGTAAKTPFGYAFTWDSTTVANGKVTIMAVAHYKNRQAVDSASVSVTISNTGMTVPDQRNNSDPDQVIDPSGVKDSTAGLQSFLNSVPNGSPGSNKTVIFPAGAKYRVNGGLTINSSYATYTTNPSDPTQILADANNGPKTYPWRVRPTGTNTIGRQSAWFMDEFANNSPLSNHATLHSHTCTGCDVGGFDGYLSGYQLDSTIGDTTNQHGFAVGSYYQHPFLATDVGRVITVSTISGSMNRIIAGVLNCATPSDNNSGCSTTADSTGHFNMVVWDATQAKQADNVNESSNGWVRWAINTSNGGWECYFTPNPSFQPKVFNGSWNDWSNATDCATSNNRGRTMVTLAGQANRWVNIQVHGSNTTWQSSIDNFDNSKPAVNEFQQTMTLGGNNNEIVGAAIDDAYGTVLNLDTHNSWVHDSRIERGQWGVGITQDNKGDTLEHNIIQLAHGSTIDFEPNGGGNNCAEDWISVINNTFGTHGIAANPGRVACYKHIKISGNHSTDQDVANGTISSTTTFMQGSHYGTLNAAGGYIIFTNNVNDALLNIPYTFDHLDHVYVANNSQKIEPRNNTFSAFQFGTSSWHSLNNMERCSITCYLQYQFDPTSDNINGSFVYPGTVAKPSNDPDSWWAKGGPEPSNYYRDLVN